jgi:hypothetical protein
MHYPTDILIGALDGGPWLLPVITTLLPRKDTEHPTGGVGGRHHPSTADATTGNPSDAPTTGPGQGAHRASLGEPTKDELYQKAKEELAKAVES